ncbi:MAG: hypothetical protein KGJ93_01690 [Patescibacteria group bacterium]|nr:hypothetical protein [Patescibacteria group bacterium]
MPSPEQTEFNRQALIDSELLRIGNFLRQHAPQKAATTLNRLRIKAGHLDQLAKEIVGHPKAKGFTYDGKFFENKTHHVFVGDGLNFLQNINTLLLEEIFDKKGTKGLIQALEQMAEQDVTEVLKQLESLDHAGNFSGLSPNPENYD